MIVNQPDIKTRKLYNRRNIYLTKDEVEKMFNRKITDISQQEELRIIPELNNKAYMIQITDNIEMAYNFFAEIKKSSVYGRIFKLIRKENFPILILDKHQEVSPAFIYNNYQNQIILTLQITINDIHKSEIDVQMYNKLFEEKIDTLRKKLGIKLELANYGQMLSYIIIQNPLFTISEAVYLTSLIPFIV